MTELLSATNLEQIPSISLGTAALLIFGAIASLAVLRGLLRILWGSLVVCIAGMAAFACWQRAPEWGRILSGGEIPWLSYVLPALAFVVAILGLRSLARFIIKPLGEPNEETAEKNRRSPVRWAVTLLLSLIPTTLLWFTGATLLRHFGSVAEIQTYFNEVSQKPDSSQAGFLVKLKEDVEQAFPQKWFATIDPLADEARIKLAKLLSVADEPPPKAIPVLEVPSIQALIMSDQELRQLARDGRYAEILRDPRLDRALENDDLREVLQGLEL
jgi:hypothetical protein